LKFRKNKYMRWVKGKTKTLMLPRTASTTFTKGDLVMFASGELVTATVSSENHVGIILTDVTSGDSDFATSAVKVPVEVPLSDMCEFEADVTGTLVTTSLGVSYDLSSASEVNQGGTTTMQVTCVGFISATKGRFVLNSQMANIDSVGI
jgi:hypothetical protein